MKKLIFPILLAIMPSMANAATVKTSLSEAINNKTINVDAVSMGGYHGTTTRLTLKNNTKSVVQVKIDPGVIFKAEGDKYQPMVLAGEEFVMVLPSATADINVYTYCGNAPRSCPSSGLKFSYAGVGNDTLVKLLKFINTNNFKTDYAAQSAVWAITNHEDIEGVYTSSNPEMAGKLRDYLVTITGRAKPQYIAVSAPREQIPDAPAYVPKTMKILANYEIILDSVKTLTLAVYNDSGKMVQEVFQNQQFGKPDKKTGHRFGVEFEAEGALQGYYYIRLKEGEVVMKETKVKVN